MDDLSKYFEKEGDRLHCKICTYDTQLENKARRHAEKRHKAKLKPVPVVVRIKGTPPKTLESEVVESQLSRLGKKK